MWRSCLTVSGTAAGGYELHDPDVQLMLEVRNDNAVAFEQLVERYQARLIAVLQHLTQRRDQAEDLAQEVFLRVFRARKRYEPGAKFSTWLFTIANNVASNSRRSLARRKEVHLVGNAGDSQAVKPLDDLAVAASGLMPARQLDKREHVEIDRRRRATAETAQLHARGCRTLVATYAPMDLCHHRGCGRLGGREAALYTTRCGRGLPR